jgi:hypothetical protein
MHQYQLVTLFFCMLTLDLHYAVPRLQDVDFDEDDEASTATSSSKQAVTTTAPAAAGATARAAGADAAAAAAEQQSAATAAATAARQKRWSALWPQPPKTADAARCRLALYFALCVRNSALLRGLYDAYARAPSSGPVREVHCTALCCKLLVTSGRALVLVVL